MNERRLRSFRLDGEVYRLAVDARARDLRQGTVTLIREADGRERTIRAADLNLPRPQAGPSLEPDRLYDLRGLVEESLALGFTDEEIIEMLEIARRHRLLRMPEDAT